MYKWGRAVSHSTILIYTQLDKPAGYFQAPTPSEITWVTTTINKYTDKITIKMTSDQVLLFTVWDLLLILFPKLNAWQLRDVYFVVNNNNIKKPTWVYIKQIYTETIIRGSAQCHSN